MTSRQCERGGGRARGSPLQAGTGVLALPLLWLATHAAAQVPSCYTDKSAFEAALLPDREVVTLDWDDPNQLLQPLPDGFEVEDVTVNYTIGDPNIGMLNLQVLDIFDTTTPTQYVGTDEVNPTFGLLFPEDSVHLTFDRPVRALGVHFVSCRGTYEGVFHVSAVGVGTCGSNATFTPLPDESEGYWVGLIAEPNQGFTEADVYSDWDLFVYNLDEIVYQLQFPRCDLNEDGTVDPNDFEVFRGAFGYSDAQPEYLSLADYDEDGTITFVDYQAWRECYRANTGPQAEPPASAGTVTVRFDPSSSVVGVGETVSISIVADMSDPVVGWGLDLAFDDSVVGLVGDPNLGSVWWSAHASDDDGLVGLAFPDSVSGLDVVLASLEVAGLAPGQTSLDLGTTPDDLTEGMPLDPNGFDTLLVEAGQVTVVPVLESSDPPADGTLPKTCKNIIRLMFNSAITLPASGQPLIITELGDPNSDVSDLFNYEIDLDDPNGATLKAQERADILTDQTWYKISPAPGFEVEGFVLELCALHGDCNGSCRVTTADYSCVKAHMAEFTEDRYDLNCSGRITTADYSVVKSHMGHRCPPKP